MLRVRRPPPPLTLPGESWRAIPGHPRYEASSLGRIRCRRYLVRHSSTDTLTRLRVVRPHILAESAPVGRRLHAHVHLAEGVHYVHDLVAEAWHGPKPPGLHVLHKDDQHTDNRPERLRYGTPSQNQQERMRLYELRRERSRAWRQRNRPPRVARPRHRPSKPDPVPPADPDYVAPF